MTDGFLPDDFETPKSVGNYLKLVDGHNKFRILSHPIMGYIQWDGNKPLRTKEKPEIDIDPTRPPKFFWTMIVWSYDYKKIMVYEITQRTIQQALEGLVRDPDFGSPLEYDLKITRSGKDLETKYDVKPLAKTPITEEIKQALFDAQVDLQKLYSGDNPFPEKK